MYVVEFVDDGPKVFVFLSVSTDPPLQINSIVTNIQDNLPYQVLVRKPLVSQINVTYMSALFLSSAVWAHQYDLSE